MKSQIFKSQHGQSLILVTLLLVALVGMLALVLDGGNTYLMRRAAQNAADAGALAGARELCVNQDPVLAEAVALEYAKDRNRASEAIVTIALDTVEVSTEIEFDTVFGSVLGRPSITAAAAAAAGCFRPGSAEGVLPVAWNCHPPAGESDSETCNIEYGPDHPYIIMDNGKTDQDLYCQDPPNSGTPVNSLDCDIDNDGYNDALEGGDRSWLDLDGGGGGAADLKEWILEGYGPTIPIHTWLPGQTGTVGSAFDAFEDPRVLGTNRLVPVYNNLCKGDPWAPGSECTGGPDSDEDRIVTVNAQDPKYYHVISFAIFHISCVWSGGNSPAPEPGIEPVNNNCPARELVGLYATGQTKSVKSVEGYFLEGTQWGLGGKIVDGIDAGAYTLFLTR